MSCRQDLEGKYRSFCLVYATDVVPPSRTTENIIPVCCLVQTMDVVLPSQSSEDDSRTESFRVGQQQGGSTMCNFKVKPSDGAFFEAWSSGVN